MIRGDKAMAEKIISTLTALYFIITIGMTLENIKQRQKKKAVIWGCLCFFPIAAVIILIFLAGHK